MEDKIMVLPTEVAEIAKNVPAEKAAEVQIVLNEIFDGVANMREQLDMVVVKGEDDITNMRLANTIRLGVRKVRLDAEKIFDAKRGEVQQKMLAYQTEDKLWLKAKQVMQILTKEIEDNARYKEETRERMQREKKEEKIRERMELITQFNPAIQRAEIENMSDEAFTIFVNGVKERYEKQLEEARKAEDERKAEEERLVKENERVKAENNRLKAEAEAKEKQLAEEKARAEKERKEVEAKKEEERIKKEALDKAPDRVKLMEFAKHIWEIERPTLSTAKANEILSNVNILLAKVIGYIEERAEKL